MKQAKSLKKSMRRCLLAAILLSVALPAGILMIIFGATGQRYVLMTFGIVFTVAGFYGMPMVWVRYGISRSGRSRARWKTGFMKRIGLRRRWGERKKK